MKVEKAIEISDAKIQFVSLVDKAANKRQFLITKADDGNAQFSSLGKVLKVDDKTHYLTGIVYEPLVEDAHGNFMTAEEIRKAAHWFAKSGDMVDVQHSFEPVDGVSVVENYIAPCDMEIGEQFVVKGTWIMTVEVENSDIWDKVQKGEVTGFSMGGIGKYSETDTDLTETVEKQGLFKRFAGLFGFDVVEKGEVAEKYSNSAKTSNFWNAWYALEETLRRYNWQTDHYEFITDEAIIREALSEFSAILTDVLNASSVVKSLGAEPIKKNKEEKEVTKKEIEEIVGEAVKKAFANTNTVQIEEAEKPVTMEDVRKMVDEAVDKALNPVEEVLTAESVRTMVTEAVTKAVEPVLKARGMSINLNGENNIEKTEDRHYLAGLL